MGSRPPRPVSGCTPWPSRCIQVNAALRNGTPGDTTYLDRAQRGWNWFRESGMINPDRMINDGLDDSCAHDRQPAWTYHQGVVLAGLAELHRATGDTGLLTTARSPADVSTVRLESDGVPGEPVVDDNWVYCASPARTTAARATGPPPRAPTSEGWEPDAHSREGTEHPAPTRRRPGA
ncbi:glycoside hydrolase family 76 protein [Streptomyces sp. NPDC051640]|uniref:glycoside hydrolase family 76 protein n=1 Tax=Streptomyces sp. NPDC051640 TaxID=3365664 RepID=UPI0037930969